MELLYTTPSEVLEYLYTCNITIVPHIAPDSPRLSHEACRCANTWKLSLFTPVYMKFSSFQIEDNATNASTFCIHHVFTLSS